MHNLDSEDREDICRYYREQQPIRIQKPALPSEVLRREHRGEGREHSYHPPSQVGTGHLHHLLHRFQICTFNLEPPRLLGGSFLESTLRIDFLANWIEQMIQGCWRGSHTCVLP